MSESIVIDKIIRSSRRTLCVEVYPHGELVVRAPKRATQLDIQSFIAKRMRWITKTLQLFKTYSPPPVAKNFVEGDKFLWLGQEYSLQISSEANASFIFEQGFVLSSRAAPKAKEVMERWYKTEAYVIFQERAAYYAHLLAVNYRKIRVSDAKKRWGSCSVAGNISFSWRLVMAPLPVIDYVVVHELAHLIEMNHSPRFWKLVASIMPEYAEHKKWLKMHGDTLTF